MSRKFFKIMCLKTIYFVLIILKCYNGEVNSTEEIIDEVEDIWNLLLPEDNQNYNETASFQPEVQNLNETVEPSTEHLNINFNDGDDLDAEFENETTTEENSFFRNMSEVNKIQMQSNEKDVNGDSDAKNSHEILLLDTSNENEETDNNYTRIIRQKIFEESYEFLDNVDPYFAMKAKSNGLIKNKLILRNRHGSKIIEDPSYNEIITKKPEPGQRSLVIIFDGTGSMLDDLKQLTAGAEAIISEITQREKNPIYNYIFVPFRDPYVGPKLVTQDLNRFLLELRNLPLFGGGDCPESAVGGINVALESALPNSFIFVFTDATANDFGLDKTTIDLIQKHQATLTFLLTGFCKSKKSEGYYVYEKLAALSNGQVFNLQKTDIKEVLESIRSSLDKDLVPLGYLYSNDSGIQSIDIPIDTNLKELTVSVAGENPVIALKDPNEVKRTDITEVLTLSNLKVVNVEDPIPGKWNVETDADSEYSVKLTALSNLNFKFGFSLKNPKSIEETNLNPTKNLNNILSIVPSDNNLVSSLTSSELVPIGSNPEDEDNTLLSLELLKSNNDDLTNSSIYVTKPFLPPTEMFKIYVKGYDAKGNPLKHLISTAIKAVDGEKPKISTPNSYVEFLEGDTGQIECKLDSSIPTTVSWKRKNEIIQAEKTSESDVYFWIFPNIKLEDSGLYVCTVESEYGTDEQTINVIVKENIIPLTVQLMQPYMVSKENDVDYQINCLVSPPENVTYSWFFGESEIRNSGNLEISSDNLIIKNVRRGNAGNYTCRASNGRTSNEHTGYLDVLFESEILSPEDEWHQVNLGENFQLNCSSTGNPLPTTEWILPPEMDIKFDSNPIQNFQVEFGGVYFCKISNGMGSEKVKNFYIDVREKPEIDKIIPSYRDKNQVLNTSSPDAGEYRILEAFAGSFSCEARGNPEPSIQWIKKSEQDTGYGSQEEIIFSEDKILFIDEPTANDAGTYVCIAENTLGTETKSINLYVVVPPRIKSIEDAMAVVMVEKGQDVNLNCEMEGLPFPRISWSFNNNSLEEYDDEYYSFGNDSLSFNANLKDSGVYECLAENEGGSATKKIILLVFVPPSIPLPNDEIINSKLGEPAVISCKPEGYPQPNVTWFLNGSQLQNSQEIYSNQYGELILENTKLSDEGMYTCEASNSHGIAQKNFYLSVNYAPRIETTLPKVVKLLPGETEILDCSASGKPSPDVIWKKDNKIIIEEKENSTLVLSNFGENISGIYICFAQNSEGFDQDYVEVINIEKPSFDEDFISSSARLINATQNDNVEIYCPIKNAESYSWFQDGKELFNKQDKILKINLVSWNEHGNYTCVGKNEAGSTDYTQELVVWSNPQFTDNSVETDSSELENKTKPKSIKLNLGQNFTLTCSPQGYPQPEVEWRKDNTILSTNPELHLSNIQVAHAGEYICKASNIFGEKEVSYNVNVLVEPTLQGPKDNWLELVENENLILKCSLVGNPWPLIYWTKNGVNLTEFQEVLEIKDPKIEDSGLYKCIGTNDLGRQEISFHVDVLAPPKFISKSQNQINVRERDKLELVCVVIGNPLPIIAWSFNNKVLWSTSSLQIDDNNKDGIMYTDQTGNPIFVPSSNETIKNSGQYGSISKQNHSLKALLVIEDPVKKKSGLYKCHSINSLGSQEETFNVQIVYPPVLKGSEGDKKPIVNITVLEDLPLILYCPWHGNPSPQITWTKNDQPIDQNDGTFSSDRKTLTVFNTNLIRHSGEYVCTAVNQEGNNYKKFSVKILVPPKFETQNDILDQNIIPYTHVIGQQTVLECPVSGNPPPTIFWLQQSNKNFDSEDNFEILMTNSSQLILDNIKSSGIYSCYANNSLGFIEKKYSVEVQRVPFINSNLPSQQTFKEYQTITLNCPAEGTPKPSIMWYKDGRFLENSVRNAQFSYDRTILKIPNARKEHSGTYTCFASNTIGETRRDIQVNVKTPVVWSNWESWTPCSKSCGTGTMTRRRRCIQLNGELASDENECKGANYESELCEMLPCPIDGGWSEWTQWSSCSKTCTDINDTFKPIRRRYRECNSPKPLYGGRYCGGLDYEEELCNTNYCAIDGGWSEWSSWTPCSSTCGTGRTERYRTCNNPFPAFGGTECKGRSSEVTYCYPGPCPIHGGWSGWSTWSECSQTCGTGFKKRSRSCSNPAPKYGGDNCPGENIEIVKCKNRKCLNSDLLKNLHFKNPFGPVAEYEVPNLHFHEHSEEDYRHAPSEAKYQFALGSQSQIKTQHKEEQKSEYVNPEGLKVVVTLKNYKPIEKDVKEISLYPGSAPFKIERIIPCPFGFELDEDNNCKDVDECKIESVCDENESCKNTEGGFICSCEKGYRFDEKQGKCSDIDECADKETNDCSHTCQNSLGGYICKCPDGYMLNPDKLSCGPDPLYSNDEYMADFAAENLTSSNNNFENECFEGYRLMDGVCLDINECAEMEDDCGIDQRCLNTKGTYLCIPTPCPDDYNKEEHSGLCYIMCIEGSECKDGAMVSEFLSYTLLPLEKIKLTEAFYTLLNYDLDRNVLVDTVFILERGKDSKLFKLETHPSKKGIAYLQAANKLRKEKLYTIRITAKSYNSNYSELLYVTKFVIYLYLL